MTFVSPCRAQTQEGAQKYPGPPVFVEPNVLGNNNLYDAYCRRGDWNSYVNAFNPEAD